MLHRSATALLVAPMSFFGIMLLLGKGPIFATVLHLGYEPYFARMLGTAKLLGVAAIVCGRFPRLKEHAYTGFAFDFIAAVVSHWAVGDSWLFILLPLPALTVLAVSYASWIALHPWLHPLLEREPPHR